MRKRISYSIILICTISVLVFADRTIDGILTAEKVRTKSLDVGNSDTTITRSSAGVIAVEGTDLLAVESAASNGQFLVATGAAAYAWESYDTARLSLGIGSTDVPQLQGIQLNHASDHTLTAVAGVLTFEGKQVSVRYSTDATITVGAAGDFLTIAEAIDYAERYKPKFQELALFTTIQLLTGFVMEEQVFVFNKDLSWIRITSEDPNAIVTIDSSELTTTLYAQGVTMDALGDPGKTNLKGDTAIPAFCFYNSFAPNIAALFAFDSNIAGDLLIGFQYKLSRGNFEAGAGCTDSAYRGLEVSLGSSVWAQDTIWNDCGVGVRVSNASFLAGAGISATGCTTAGLAVGTGVASVTGSDFSGSGVGILATGASNISATSVDVSGCATGLSARNGAFIQAFTADANDCTTNALIAYDGGTIDAYQCDANACTGEYAIYAYDGGKITCTEATALASGTVAALRARWGGTIIAPRVDVTGSATGINTNEGGTVTAPYAVLVDCTARGIRADGGSVMVDNSTITGWTTNGVYANEGAIIQMTGCDVQESGVSSNDDILLVAGSGSLVFANDVTGGSSIRVNTQMAAGLITSNTVTHTSDPFTDAHTFGTIELGHATANTLTGSSGLLSVEGKVVYSADGTDVPVVDGGTGRSTSTTAYALIAAGTTATGAHQTLPAGATTEMLVGAGAAALPAWTTATGTGAPVRTGSPDITTPAIIGATLTGVLDAGGATSLEIPNGTDPDVTEGQISQDTDGAGETGDVIIRGADGSGNQWPVGRKIVILSAGVVIAPNDMTDAARDKCGYIFYNTSGMDVTITEINCESDTDDTAFTFIEYDEDGATNLATVDAVNCATGSGPYTVTETTITGATIEDTHKVYIDFDDTDTPGIVSWQIKGWYNANVAP